MNIDIFRFDIPNLSDLEKAVVSSLSEIYRPGTSKRKAREEYNRQIREEARRNGVSNEEIAKMPWLESTYIHSISTFLQYIDEGRRFARWLEERHPDAQKLKYCYKMGYARDYIQMLIDTGDSASTIAKITSALAKLFRVHAEDIHDNRPARLYSQFTRSRYYDEECYKKDLKTYGPKAEICYITGVRECELEELVPECFFIDTNNKVALHLDGKKQNTKNGMSRDVTIIENNQRRIKEILITLEPGKKICPKVPDRLDVHGIRSLYAMDLYNSVARPIDTLKEERIPLKHPKKDSRSQKIRYTAPAIYQRKDGMCYDRVALLIVSASLGHSREDVVVHCYLR